jgi:hypothetical protein
MKAVALACLLAPGIALADTPAPADDGYCDYVEGVASATAAPLVAPEAFGQFGYIEQAPFAINPSTTSDNLRAIGGVRYSLTNLYGGLAWKDRGHADCRRHSALLRVRGASAARALAARVAVYDDAQPEADKIMNEVESDMQARRTTAQEATATRLRVEELRALTADARRELSALPPPDERPLNSVLAEFQTADAAMESADARVRTSQAYDVSIRFGFDQFLEGPNQSTQYFAVLQLGVNLGALWMPSANHQAAAGRSRFVRSGHDPLGADATVDMLRGMIDVEGKRAEQTEALVADLDRQLQALAKLGGDDSKRYRETVWFDYIKAKADLAYLKAHVKALREVIGGEGS